MAVTLNRLRHSVARHGLWPAARGCWRRSPAARTLSRLLFLLHELAARGRARRSPASRISTTASAARPIADAAFCRALAARLGVACRRRATSTSRPRQARRCSLEVAGRTARYDVSSSKPPHAARRSRSPSRTRATIRPRPSCCASCAAAARPGSAGSCPRRGRIVRPLLDMLARRSCGPDLEPRRSPGGRMPPMPTSALHATACGTNCCPTCGRTSRRASTACWRGTADVARARTMLLTSRADGAFQRGGSGGGRPAWPSRPRRSPALPPALPRRRGPAGA